MRRTLFLLFVLLMLAGCGDAEVECPPVAVGALTTAAASVALHRVVVDLSESDAPALAACRDSCGPDHGAILSCFEARTK